MDKKDFIKNISEEINKHNAIAKLTGTPSYYFSITPIIFSKRKKNVATKWNEEYYHWLGKKRAVLTNSMEHLLAFVKNTFKDVPIVFKTTTFFPGKSISIGIIKNEIDFSTIPTIKEYLTTAKENKEKKIVECLKKQLKLTNKDKIHFLFLVGEGKPAGKLEQTAGEAIISGKIYAFFWLKFNEKKEYYLDYLKPIKIKKLD